MRVLMDALGGPNGLALHVNSVRWEERDEGIHEQDVVARWSGNHAGDGRHADVRPVTCWQDRS